MGCGSCPDLWRFSWLGGYCSHPPGSVRRRSAALLRNRQHRIEELKRENDDLRRWADTPLPADIIRLRERTALAGGAAYRQWLSQSDAVQPEPISAAHLRRPERDTG
ncbi:hypothetical protein A8A57_07235 [Lelliottia amnigena]|nr:hypothetical protein A8A57_07235 [Lelliottia amnigena]